MCCCCLFILMPNGILNYIPTYNINIKYMHTYSEFCKITLIVNINIIAWHLCLLVYVRSSRASKQYMYIQTALYFITLKKSPLSLFQLPKLALLYANFIHLFHQLPYIIETEIISVYKIGWLYNQRDEHINIKLTYLKSSFFFVFS